MIGTKIRKFVVDYIVFTLHSGLIRILVYEDAAHHFFKGAD